MSHTTSTTEIADVDLTGLDPDIHAVQWDGAAGEIESRDGRPPEVMDDLASFQPVVDPGTAAAPPAPTPDELKALKRGAFMTEGLRRIALQVPDRDSIEAIPSRGELDALGPTQADPFGDGTGRPSHAA